MVLLLTLLVWLVLLPQACYLCGESTHRSWECPKKNMEIYQLPDHIKQKVQEQYERDVARVSGEGVVKMEDEYKSFLRVGALGWAGLGAGLGWVEDDRWME